MSKSCEVCGKKRMVGNNVSHAKNRTKRTFNPNLQRVKIVEAGGQVRHARVCTRCLRSGAVAKAI